MSVRLIDNNVRPIPRPTDTVGTWWWPDDPTTWPDNAYDTIPDEWVIVWAAPRGQSGWYCWPGPNT